jgi:hypothetical protein
MLPEMSVMRSTDAAVRGSRLKMMAADSCVSASIHLSNVVHARLKLATTPVVALVTTELGGRTMLGRTQMRAGWAGDPADAATAARARTPAKAAMRAIAGVAGTVDTAGVILSG